MIRLYAYKKLCILNVSVRLGVNREERMTTFQLYKQLTPTEHRGE